MIPINSKHKGEQWEPVTNILYHKANPKFRDQIKSEGLRLMKGESYSLHSPEDNEPPAIFTYFGDWWEGYETGYFDDVWTIDITKINNIWFKDLQVGGWGTALVSYCNTIPPEALILLYEGSGEVDPNF